MKLIEDSKYKNELARREDWRVEWICPHGIGHTIMIPDNVPKEEGIPIEETREAWFIHGCDGCCAKNKKHIDEILKDIK